MEEAGPTTNRGSDVWWLVGIVACAALIHRYAGLRDQDAPKELLVLLGTVLFVGFRRGPALLRRDRTPIGVTAAAIIAVAFLALILFAATRALDAHAAIRRAALWTSGIVLAIETMVSVTTTDSRRRLALGLCGVGVAVALWGLGQWFFGGVLGRARVQSEPVSTLGNTSFAAGFVVILVPLAVALAFDRALRGVIRKSAGVAVLLLVGFVVVTKSRTDYVALVAAGVAAAGLAAAARRRRKALIVWGAAVLVMAGGLVFLRQSERIGRIDTIQVRELIWKSSLPLLESNPATGIGLTDFVAEFPRTRSTEEYELSLHRDVLTAHNDPLEIAIEAGWPAAALWIALVGLAVWSSLRAARETNDDSERRLRIALAATVVAAFVSGLANSPLSHPPHLALTLIVIGAALATETRSRLLSLPRIVPTAAAVVAAAGILIGSWYSFNHLRADRSLFRLSVTKRVDLQAELAAEALEHEPNNIDAVILNVQRLRDQLNAENANRAYALCQRALRIRPHDVRLLVLIAQLHRFGGQPGTSMRLLDRALEINPNYTNAKVERHIATCAIATAAAGDGDLQTARERLGPAVRAMVAEGGSVFARNQIARLVASAPKHGPKLIEQLALEADAAGEHDVVTAYAGGLAASGAASGDTWSHLERAARERGEEQLATFYLVRAKLAYAYEYALKGDATEAERHLRRAEARGVAPSEAIMVRAILAVKRGQLPDAQKLLQSAVDAGFSDLARLRSWEFDVFDPISGANPIWERAVLGVIRNAERAETR